jgi:hypothetical protein
VLIEVAEAFVEMAGEKKGISPILAIWKDLKVACATQIDYWKLDLSPFSNPTGRSLRRLTMPW